MTFISKAIASAIGIAAIPACLAPAAHAACAQWRMPTEFNIVQANGARASCTIAQGNRRNLTATCDSRGTSGKAEGSLNGREFTMDVKWGNGSVGVYTAVLRGDTRVSFEHGRTFDRTHPARWSLWTSPERAACR
jgi:hypothetical protein